MASCFCPTDGNQLLVEEDGETGLRFFCLTCPYVYEVEQKISRLVPTQKKEVDDVLGGEDAWKNVDKTATTCPKCDFHEAYFMQIQIRSADEPATLFFRCVKCSHQWREG